MGPVSRCALIISFLMACSNAKAQVEPHLSFESPLAKDRQQTIETEAIWKLGKSEGVVLTEDAVLHLRAALFGAGPAMIDFKAAIQRLPIIEVIVSPVPPRDFVVQINGRDYPASEESKYGVRPGPVDLVVKRGAMPPCAHKLVVTKHTVVRCNL